MVALVLFLLLSALPVAGQDAERDRLAAATLTWLEQKVENMERDEHAREVAGPLIRHARQELDGAQKLYREAKPGYAEQISRAEVAVADALFVVHANEERIRSRGSFWWLLLILVGFLIMGLNERVLPVKEEAEALFVSLEAALDPGELSRLEERAGRLAAGEKVRQVREDLATLATLHAGAGKRLEEVRKLMRPGVHNFFFPDRYTQALFMLQDASYTKHLEEIRVRVAGALDGLDALQELSGRLVEIRAAIAAEEKRVESSRREMSAALGLAPDLLLREEGSDPFEMLRAAAFQANEAEACLDRAEVKPAAEALESAGRFLSEAASIVAASRKACEGHETAMAERLAETERLAALIPEHEAALAGIRQDFAESVLGGAGNSGADAQQEFAAARKKLRLAEAAIREGRLLAAADLRAQARGHQEKAALGIWKIGDLRLRLDQTRAANRTLLEELEARAEETAAGVRSVRGRIDAGREDPLLVRRELVAAREGLDRVDNAG